MKKIYTIISTAIIVFCMASCQGDLLERPDTSGTTDLKKVFSSAVTAEENLAATYRLALVHGLPGGMSFSHGTYACISGERLRGWSWHAPYEVTVAGLKVSDVLNGRGGAGTDNFSDTWAAVRACYIIKDNIDKVPDMSLEMKERIKAEATALIAYRYMGMFYRYGGMPIVRKAFLPTDNLNIERASLEDMLQFIMDLCDEAYAGLPEIWEDNKYTGRMTKGAVLAIRARTLQFAARPLFNSATPVISDAKAANMVCFGNEDQQRWRDAIEAHEAVLAWAAANGCELVNTGGAATGQPNPNSLDDYGNAVSLPGNREIILAYKFDDAVRNKENNPIAKFNNTSPYLTGDHDRYETEKSGLPTGFLELYYSKDGTTPAWPKPGASASSPASLWINNMADIEDRFRADWLAPFVVNVSNPGDNNWSLQGWGRMPAKVFHGTTFPNSGPSSGTGAATTTKFYYGAGSRTWFEMPLFRLAETYLSLAEAYNEVGDHANALRNLNMVHNRAGLPAVTETDQNTLRQIIWREKAIEFNAENHRYFDVKHWKHPDIANGVLGGPIRELQFLSVISDQSTMFLPGNLSSFWDRVDYDSYWHPKMYLEPIPQNEVNKGYITQNPGY